MSAHASLSVYAPRVPHRAVLHTISTAPLAPGGCELAKPERAPRWSVGESIPPPGECHRSMDHATRNGGVKLDARTAEFSVLRAGLASARRRRREASGQR